MLHTNVHGGNVVRQDFPTQDEELVKWAAQLFGGVTSFTTLRYPQNIAFTEAKGKSCVQYRRYYTDRIKSKTINFCAKDISSVAAPTCITQHWRCSSVIKEWCRVLSRAALKEYITKLILSAVCVWKPFLVKSLGNIVLWMVLFPPLAAVSSLLFFTYFTDKLIFNVVLNNVRESTNQWNMLLWTVCQGHTNLRLDQMMTPANTTLCALDI